jgi:hypothetical protein
LFSLPPLYIVGIVRTPHWRAFAFSPPALNPLLSRRTFIAAGIIGAAALVTASWLKGPHSPPGAVPRRALDADGEAIMTAIIPVMLAGALPGEPGAQGAALARTLSAVDAAIAGLAPAVQAEVAQLFALLALPPVRWGLAGISPSWSQASGADVRRFLDRLRGSRLTLPRSAYAALHEITFAAWYGMPESWPAIGYPGPPEVA